MGDVFSLNESRRHSPNSSHGALVQHSISELVFGKTVLISKPVISVKILSFFTFCQKFEIGKGRKREGRKASKLCRFWEGHGSAHNTVGRNQWSSSASPIVLCTFMWSPDTLSVCLYVPHKQCMGDSWHTYKTYLSGLAAAIREWGLSESGSNAFYNVYVPVCLWDEWTSLAAASCRIPIGPLQLIAQLLIWGRNHCQYSTVKR